MQKFKKPPADSENQHTKTFSCLTAPVRFQFARFVPLVLVLLAMGLVWLLSCSKLQKIGWVELPGIYVYEDILHYDSWEQTRAVYDSLLTQTRARADFPAAWELLLKIAILHEYAGNLDSARFFLLTAQSFADQHDLHSRQAVTSLRLGVLAGKIGDVEEAEIYFNQAAGQSRLAWGDSLQACYLSYRANLRFMQESYDEAIYNYQQALQLYQRLQMPRGEWLCLMSMGLAHVEQGDFADAQQWYARADSSTWGKSDGYARASSLLNRGELSYKMNEIAAALQKFREVRQLLADLRGRELETAELRWQAYLGEARCCWKQNRRAEAEEAAKNAVEILEEQTRSVANDAIKRHYLEQRQAAFAEMVGIYLGLKKYPKALEAAERGRSRAFLDLLQERGIHLRPPDEKQLASLRQHERRLNLYAALAEEKIAMTAPEALPATRLRGDTEVALSPVLNPLAGELRSLSSVTPISFQALVELAGTKQTTLLEYFVMRDSLAIFLLKPNGNLICRTTRVSRDSLTKVIAKLLAQIAAPRWRTDWRNVTRVQVSSEPAADSLEGAVALRNLYDWLIAPIAAQLPAEPQQVVTIIPHDVLFLVPFAALLDGNKHYLIESHVLATVPSAGVLKFTEQKRLHALSRQNPHLLVIGDPQYPSQSNLRPLAGAKMEAETIARLFPPDRNDLFSGELARESEIKRLAPGYTILHFATHGLLNEQAPMLSALALAADSLDGGDDGFLTCAEIFSMTQLHADLIVLSACQTGRGQITGDGILGLSRAFLYAGTPTLIVTQWSIDDQATSFLMAEFYQEYRRTSRKAMALREAQLRTLAKYKAPFYWAAFVVVGED